MAELACNLSEVYQPPIHSQPVLSIVIPSYNRANELALAIGSISEQIKDGLENKVELVLSDNASGEAAAGVIKAMAARWPFISYFMNERDEGGYFNLFSAPWRARGLYTWTFGSDDALLEGGVAHVVGQIEREAPSFMTLNKRVANADLSELLSENINSTPDRRFDTFIDLFCAMGVNQLAFISAQIEHTDTARQLDARAFLRCETRHPHVAAFLKKHAHRPAFYSRSNHLLHRVDNSQMLDYHSGNFHDYAITLPRLLWQVNEEVAGPKDLFERITGNKNVQSYDPPQVTFVDSIFENMLRAMGFGSLLSHADYRFYETALAQCRSDRWGQFEQLWDYSRQLTGLIDQFNTADAALKAARQAAMNTSAVFTQPTGAAGQPSGL